MTPLPAGERRYAALAAVLVATPLVAGAATVALLQRQLPQPDAPEAPVTLEVAGESTRERQPAVFSATFSQPRALYSPFSGGVTTALHVAPGAEVADGDRLLQVDGIDRLALRSPAPPWRDLGAGARGDDVVALQRFLARHGWVDGAADGVFGAATAAGVRRLSEALGYERPQAVASRAWFVWLPDEPFRVGTLATEVGGGVPAAGAELATEATLVAGVTLGGLQDEPLALDPTGRYVATLGSLTDLPVELEGREGRPALAAPALTSLSPDAFDDSGVATGFVERAAPVEVTAVPAAAVLDGPEGVCVYVLTAGGPAAAPVTVSGSRGGDALLSGGLEPGQRVVVNPRASGVAERCP